MQWSGFIFQQDGDLKHTWRKALNWFQDHHIDVLEWPAQSPDLNPIEHLWDHLKWGLNSYENHPTSIHELKRRVKVEWNNIDPNVYKDLIFSMLRRLEAVIQAKGDSIKYWYTNCSSLLYFLFNFSYSSQTSYSPVYPYKI
jgi:hypothetical protein